MKLWLTQRAESTPHDNDGKSRPMRTGLMAEYFSSQGHDVTWWTGDYDHYGRQQRNFGNVTKQVTPSYAVRYLAAQGYKRSLSLARLTYDKTVAQQFLDQAPHATLPDVIIASLPSVDLALASVRFGIAHNIPVIVDIRDLHPDVFIDQAPKLAKPALYLTTRPMYRKVKEICAGATALWGNTDAFVAWGCKAAGRARQPADQTFPIAYKASDIAIDDLRAVDAKWVRAGLLQQDKINAVFFGTFSKSFNFKPVFEAARLLDGENTPHRFYFFGGGALNDDVVAHCASCANSHFMGWADANHLQAAMRASSIGLAPYIPVANYTQNMPNKPTEYMGGGLGVALGLKHSVLTDFLTKNHAGFSYETGTELAAQLRFYAQDPTALATLQVNAKRAFEYNFNYQSLSERMLDAIAALKNSPKARDRPR